MSESTFSSKLIFYGAIGAVLLLASPCSASDYYKVSVTRSAQDIYKVDGADIYIKTRYCYEYVYSDEAIVEIDSPVGYTVGKIIFTGDDGSTCDIEKVLS